jgi:alpha-tubulin suppressor-like RCC1 family protein
MNRIYNPRKIPIHHVSAHQLKSIDAGESFSAFLTNDGDVFTFGDNSEG